MEKSQASFLVRIQQKNHRGYTIAMLQDRGQDFKEESNGIVVKFETEDELENHKQIVKEYL